MKKSVLVFVFLLPIFASAQQHPLAVESQSLLPPGQALIEMGASYFQQQPFPLSGLTGDLSKIGTVRFTISLSEYVELQTDGTVLNILSVTERKPAFNSIRTTSRSTTTDIGDFTVWTKFGVVSEYSYGIGLSVRFGVQLPNASNESGLGIDEMNFYSSLLFQKHIAGRWTVNAGLGILSDPTQVGSQHDVFVYGLEYFLPVGETVYLLLQTAGRAGHDGIGVSRLANGKLALEKNFGTVSARFAGVANFSPADNAQGVEFSVSYFFHVVDIK